MNIESISEYFNIVLALVTLFQWIDKRSKNKAIENFVSATQNMTSHLLKQYSKNTIIYQKAIDITENCKAIINTVRGKYYKQESTIWSRWWSKFY